MALERWRFVELQAVPQVPQAAVLLPGSNGFGLYALHAAWAALSLSRWFVIPVSPAVLC